MASLGELFVAIRPDTTGFGPELSKGLNALMPITNAAGMNLGKGLVGGLGKAGIAGAVIAVGAAIVSVGNEFDTQYRRISASTGATGDKLKGLEGSFKNVAKNSGASFADIGTALIEVSKRTGQTGAGLETTTRQFLALSKMAGGDVKTNIESATRAFGAWGVSVQDQSPKLDELFKLNQQTGVSVSDLEQKLQKFSAPLRQFGFGFDEAAVMLAKWQKEGVNTDTALAGLRLAIRNTTLEAGRVKLSKDLGFTISKDPKTALEQLSTAIRTAGTDSAATKIAIDAFGSRAGPELAKDIRTGKMSYDDLMKSVQGSKDTILDAAKRNATLGSSFEKLKNQIKVALEPMAVPAMEGLRKVMDALAPVVVKLVEAWRKLSPLILVLMPGIIGFKVVLMALSPVLSALNWLLDKVGKAISAAIGWFKEFPKHISHAGSAIADFFTKLPGRIVDFFAQLPGRIVDFFSRLPGWIVQGIGDLGRIGKSIIVKFVSGITTAASAVWDFFTSLPGRILGAIGSLAQTLWNKGLELIGGISRGIEAAAGAVWGWFKSLPGKIIGAIGDAAGWLLDVGKKIVEGLYNGITNALGNIGDWINEHIVKPVKDAVTGLFDIFSPSKVFYGYGQNLMQGMQEGIDKHKGPVEAVQRMGAAMMAAVKPITLPVPVGPGATATAAAAAAAATVARPAAVALPAPSAPKAVAGPNLTVAVQAETKGLDAAVKASAGQLMKLPKAVTVPITAPGVQQTTGLLTVFNRTTGAGQTSVTGLRQAVEKVPASTAAAGAALGRTSQDLLRFSGRTDAATGDVVGFGGQVRARPGELSALGTSLGHGGDMLRGFGTRTDGAAATVVAFGGQVRLRPGELAQLGTSLGHGGGALDTFRGKTDTGSGAVDTFGGKLRDSPGNLQIMQHAVDAMHGKAFDVAATAKVNQPDWKALIAEAKKQLQAVGQSFAAGGIHGTDLPRDAVIAPPQPGGGLVQWAEPGTGGEAFIPLASDRRQRSLEVWRRTGKHLGAFALGGLLNPDLKLLTDQWQPGIDATANAANEFTRATGQDFADRSAAAAGKDFAVGALKYLLAQVATGPGGNISGNWAPTIRPWVEYIARSLNISAMTYAGHHPAENYAADLALSQAGMVNTAPSTGPSGTDLYSKVARWVDQHIISAPTPGWYVGVHAAIKSRGGAWHPASDQLGTRGQTHSHDDHVHVSFDPRGGVPMIGVPGNSSLPGFSWDHGGDAPNVAGGAGLGSAAAGQFGATGPSGGPYSQAQMEASLRKFTNAAAAHQLSAIGMAETGGRLFPNFIPGYGDGHGPYGFLARYTSGFADMGRLDRDLDYASERAVFLYNQPPAGPTHGKWETWPGLASRYLDEGGWLPPGSSLVINQTGQPERVIGPATDDALVAELRALPRKVGRAVADALNGVASYATMQV